MEAYISARKLTKTFGSHTVIHEFSFDVYPNEMLVIKGPSGSGKTTLLNLICGLEKPCGGDILHHINPSDLSQQRIPIVFQEFESLLPWKTVREHLKMLDKSSHADTIDGVLKSVHLFEHSGKYPHELSGGMKQRLCIAQALICNSRLVLMDEPFANLDAILRESLEHTILDLHQHTQTTFIIVTHQSLPNIEEKARIIHSDSWKQSVPSP